MPESGFKKVSDRHSAEAVLFPACFKAHQVLLGKVNLYGVLDYEGAFFWRNEFSKDRQERRFSSAGAATDQDVLASKNIVFEAVRDHAVESPRRDQILHLKIPGVELTDGQSDAAQTARRNDHRNATAIGQSRIENGFRLRDIVAQATRDILDGDHQGPVAEGYTRNTLQKTVSFDEHMLGAIHHHFADRLIENQVFDRFQKRQDHFESVHHRAPRVNCSKYDWFG